MKKMITLLLCLCMMGTLCMPAMAEDNGTGWKVEADVNKDQFCYLLQALLMKMGQESSDTLMEGAEALVDLVNKTALSGEGDDNTLRVSLDINGSTVADGAIGMTADGDMAAITNLLEGYAIYLPAEKLAQLAVRLQTMLEQAADVDWLAATEKLMTGVQARMDEFSAAVEEKKTAESRESVTVSIAGEEHTFSVMTEYRMTMGELLTYTETMTNGILLHLKDFCLDVGIPEDQVSVTLSEGDFSAENTDMQAPVVLTMYDEYDPYLMRREMARVVVTGEGEEKKTQSIYSVTNGIEGADITVVTMTQMMEGEEVTYIAWKCESDETEEESYTVMTLNVTGTVFVLDTRTYDRMNGGQDTEMKFYLNSTDAPLATLKFSRWPLENAPETIVPDGMQLLDVTAEDGETQLKQAVKTALGNLAIQVINAAPEEVTVLLNTVTQMQQ